MRRCHRPILSVFRISRAQVEPSFKKLGSNLMNQQCWCWGCDIRRSKGNLLLAFGFERLRPPEGVEGSSCYRITLRSALVVTLWGFGAIISDHVRAVHVGRFEFNPQLCAALGKTNSCWHPSDLPPLSRPSSPHELMRVGSLCSELLTFIGEYESWVTESVGIRYRQQNLDKFKDATYTAMEASLLWPRLAKQVARYYRRRATSNSNVIPHGFSGVRSGS